MPHTFQVSAKGIAVHGAKVLLLLGKPKEDSRNEYAWDLPGGRLEHGESVEAGLAREVTEELPGNSITKIHNLIDAKVDWHRASQHDIVVLCFKIELASTAIGLSDEHHDFRWINQAELGSLVKDTGWPLMSDQVRAVQKVLTEIALQK